MTKSELVQRIEELIHNALVNPDPIDAYLDKIFGPQTENTPGEK
jgi:hypothetical protein